MVTQGGHRYYSCQDVDAYISRGDAVTPAVGYVWVPPGLADLVAIERRDALDSYIRQQGRGSHVIVDRGESCDMERQGLRDLLGLLLDGGAMRLVIGDRMALTEGGASLVLTLCDVMGMPVVDVADDSVGEPSPPAEAPGVPGLDQCLDQHWDQHWDQPVANCDGGFASSTAEPDAALTAPQKQGQDVAAVSEPSADRGFGQMAL